MKHIVPVLLLLAAPTTLLAEDLSSNVNGQLSGLVETYKRLHAHPEHIKGPNLHGSNA